MDKEPKAPKLIITVHRAGKKHATIVAEMGDHFSLVDARKVFEAEQNLNSLSGSPLRWHFHVE
jgi:hypothetical protein